MRGSFAFIIELANRAGGGDQPLMTASELQDLLVGALVRHAGGTRRRWRTAVGPVRLHDVATHPHCNWSIDPSGGAREVGEIERLLDRIRLEHPLVAAD